MAIEKDFFRQVMGRFATGVTVVTTSNQGVLAGLTVNAFCSVSLNPPLVLVCIDLSSNTVPLFRDSKAFAVNMLTEQQEHLSRCFSTASPERYEYFCHATYHTAATGAPILDDVLAFIDARIVAEYPGGDHVIFLGQVEAMGMPGQVSFAQDAQSQGDKPVFSEARAALENPSPLLYYKAKYRQLPDTTRKPSLAGYYDEEFT
ncbi:flavin reductase [Ktedonosporobacter rubrisoli]|uniref:Flavin reductase n=1 Tax=Ktedonosporobacter rubrisoli TaxID=2509675 RepID=A0A4P6JSQ5_KTERU|nr:flavin reductase family protein [Ktedonosporobacter rubrisoli]QBD78262.1 flavin reductase [Ktedonosporobacter rubrisoli]